jgi:galactokinase
LGRTFASAPARADFLNTHQDYKGLAVVPVALNLRTYLTAERTETDYICVKSSDLKSYNEPDEDTFQITNSGLLQKGFFGNYFRGVLRVIAKRGKLDRIRGLNIIVKSEIPIGSGLGSSAALEVAFVALLNHNFNLGFATREMAEVAFLAENQELKAACGRLDQYGVAFGGIIKLDCKPPYEVETLPFTSLVFAIADSGIRHFTSDIHPKRQAEVDRGLKTLMAQRNVPNSLKAKLGYTFSDPKWDVISEAEITDYLSSLDDEASRRILFTIRMNKLTEFALGILRLQPTREKDVLLNLNQEAVTKIQQTPVDERPYMYLGQVMNQQHALLRDLYDVSIPRIERIQAAALSAGAYGAKISGAGMGGCVIALAKNNEAGERVVRACLSAGARAGWVSTVGEGAKAW